MAQSEKKADFNSIRAEVEKIQKLYGGRINIEQWFSNDDECLKVVMTWKKGQPHQQSHSHVYATDGLGNQVKIAL